MWSIGIQPEQQTRLRWRRPPWQSPTQASGGGPALNLPPCQKISKTNKTQNCSSTSWRDSHWKMSNYRVLFVCFFFAQSCDKSEAATTCYSHVLKYFEAINYYYYYIILDGIKDSKLHESVWKWQFIPQQVISKKNSDLYLKIYFYCTIEFSFDKVRDIWDNWRNCSFL